MNPPPPPPLPTPSKGVPTAVWIGCGGCAVLGLLVVLLVGSIAFSILSTIRNTGPFQHTLAAAQASPEMREALGEPITLGWYFTGSFNWSNNNGEANGHIPISGPKDSASVQVIGRVKSGESWSFEKMDARIDSTRQMISLLPWSDSLLIEDESR